MAFALPMHHHTPSHTPFSTPRPASAGFYTPQQQQQHQHQRQQQQPAFTFPTTTTTDVFGTPDNSGGSPHRASATATTSQPARPKGYRYNAYASVYAPANSSPLARVASVDNDNDYEYEDDMDDGDMDEHEHDRGSFHEPSSPLGRVAPAPPSSAFFTMGSSAHRERASAEDLESPLVQRRRAQYKSTTSSLGGSGRRSSLPSTFAASSSPARSPPAVALFGFGGQASSAQKDSQHALLRERFKRRCFERAAKAREKAVKARRRKVDGVQDYFEETDEERGEGKERSRGKRRKDGKGKGREVGDNNGVDGDVGMDGDEEDSEGDEENEEDIINDELFRRIMANVNRKMQHSYRVSYALDVGSSFDPDLEDVSQWEEELKAPPTSSALRPAPPAFQSSSSSLSSSSTTNSAAALPSEDISPAFFEDEELEAYAEECARLMEEMNREQGEGGELGEGQEAYGEGERERGEDDVLAGLEDVPVDELFAPWNWSESEGEDVGEDVDMDMS